MNGVKNAIIQVTYFFNGPILNLFVFLFLFFVILFYIERERERERKRETERERERETERVTIYVKCSPDLPLESQIAISKC